MLQNICLSLRCSVLFETLRPLELFTISNWYYHAFQISCDHLFLDYFWDTNLLLHDTLHHFHTSAGYSAQILLNKQKHIMWLTTKWERKQMKRAAAIPSAGSESTSLSPSWVLVFNQLSWSGKNQSLHLNFTLLLIFYLSKLHVTCISVPKMSKSDSTSIHNCSLSQSPKAQF